MNILALLTTFLPVIMQAGGIATQAFPAIQGVIQAIEGGVANPSQQINIVSLIQEALNALNTAGVIALPKPLVVDGHFGGSTFAAIKLLQAYLGITIGEPLASYEMQALQALLAKL
jgi:hypothetical protein